MHYAPTTEGIIYTKKMMKQIFDVIEKGEFDKIVQKIEQGKQAKASKLPNGMNLDNQPDTLSKIANFGLNNINTFYDIVKTVLTQH